MKTQFEITKETLKYVLSLNRGDISGDLELVHIITTDCSDNRVTKKLAKLYISSLSSICKNLNIIYSKINLTGVDVDDECIKATIMEVNADPSVHGIIYDFPFITSGKPDIFRKYITSSKDIGFYCEKTFLRYCNNPSVVSPYVYILDKFQSIYFDKLTFISYTIIQNSTNGSHKGLVPYQNNNYCKYTLLTNLHNYVNDFNSDVVISLMTGISSVKAHKPTGKCYSPKFILDFGYTSSGKIGSLDRRHFAKDIPYYTWDTHMIDMYVYGVLNNMINKH
jgi:hypothetical protein